MFHAWRSFLYDENAEIIDACIQQICQVTERLIYDKSQVFKVFKKTLPSLLYWVLFPIDNLHLKVDIIRRILTKEKLDKQQAGQGSSITPFIAFKEEKKSEQKSVIFGEEIVVNDKNRQANSLDRKVSHPSHPEYTKAEADPSVILDREIRITMIGIGITAKKIRNITLSETSGTIQTTGRIEIGSVTEGGVETEATKVDIGVIEVLRMCTIRRGLAQRTRSDEKRSHYYREVGNFVREYEKKTKIWL